MKRSSVVGLMLVFALLVPVQAASAASVRLPKSATDWATFSSEERAAAYDWVQADYDRLAAKGNLVIKTYSSGASDSGDLTTAAVTGTVNCGFNVASVTYGTYTNAWVSTSTTEPVFSVDTGGQGIMDKFYRDGTRLNQFAAGGGGSFILAKSSPPNFKWWFEGVTYTVQGWGSAQTSPTAFIFKNRYCENQVSP